MLLSINKFTCQSLVNCEIAKASSKGQSIVNVWILQGSVRTFDHQITTPYHFPTFPKGPFGSIWALSPVGCDVHRWAPDPRPWPIQTSVEDSGLVQGLFSWLWNEWNRAANLLKPSGLKHIWTLFEHFPYLIDVFLLKVENLTLSWYGNCICKYLRPGMPSAPGWMKRSLPLRI